LSEKKEDYPECEKLSRVYDQIVAITQFMEWLGSKKIILGTWIKPIEGVDEAFYPCMKGTREFLNEYFGLDPEKMEKERRKMLMKLRIENAKNI